MFTGIITDLGIVGSVTKGTTIVLEINTNFDTSKILLGSSISVNGVCLTVTKKTGNSLFFDVSNETLKATNFNFLKVGDNVNLEEALKLGDQLGGHIVQGHVDFTSPITKIEKGDNFHRFYLKIKEKYMVYIVSKASITINGVSLTINEVLFEENKIQVNIIPHTLEKTTFKNIVENDLVNIEVDYFSKYIENIIVNKNKFGN